MNAEIVDGTKTDDWDGVHGLGSPSSVAVSTDAEHVYVTSESEDAVAVFGVSRCINVHVPLLLKD